MTLVHLFRYIIADSLLCNHGQGIFVAFQFPYRVSAGFSQPISQLCQHCHVLFIQPCDIDRFQPFYPKQIIRRDMQETAWKAPVPTS